MKTNLTITIELESEDTDPAEIAAGLGNQIFLMTEQGTIVAHTKKGHEVYITNFVFDFQPRPAEFFEPKKEPN